MSKEYHYIVKWSEREGWQIDPDIESSNFPEGTIYDTEVGEWQLGYLGDGEYNGKEQELTETLADILDLHNSMKGIK
jgi:hypothetical protein